MWDHVWNNAAAILFFFETLISFQIQRLDCGQLYFTELKVCTTAKLNTQFCLLTLKYADHSTRFQVESARILPMADSNIHNICNPREKYLHHCASETKPNNSFLGWNQRNTRHFTEEMKQEKRKKKKEPELSKFCIHLVYTHTTVDGYSSLGCHQWVADRKQSSSNYVAHLSTE